MGQARHLRTNAGIVGPTASIEAIRFEARRRCLAVNLNGALLACRHAVPMMKRQGGCDVVLTSSTAGLGGIAHRETYFVAKWAVIGLVKMLEIELGASGIRANALCSGAVDGSRMDGVIAREAMARNVSEDEIREGYTAGAAMRTFNEAGDVSSSAVYLASPQVRYVSA